ncbi:uncharacterized protein LOC129719780 [Wyeomyia smithii]|uniref:uncharacterized protein LOC129719780 n=1 Tax=Wyeomyia smithii TaxID=174621 RepID=UPI00246815CD|nr:uncharacterized protein LOC129719780 [Wyeomyia smithii]
MTNYKWARNDMTTILRLKKPQQDDRVHEDLEHLELVGGLQFVAQCTRPDISHAVSIVSSFCSNPGFAHWTAAKRILRYLKGTKHEKLTYRRNEDTDFYGYSDADWGNDPDTRRSVSGYVFLQNGGAVSWNSKRQSTVALSTTEAEYMALSTATQEAMWWKGFLFELHGTNQALMLKCDNKSAINLAEREVGYSARSKHIDIRHHYIREQVEQKLIKLEHVPSDLQAADILTKSIPGPKQNKDRKKLGIL